MSWLASIGVAILTGALALFLAGFVANACVTWYRVSGFEGKAGYFVVATALLGGIAGFVLGLVLARLVAAGAIPGVGRGFGPGLGVACAVVLGIAAVVALVCRLLADVPPRLRGQELMLQVELRLPSGAASPVELSGKSSITLGSVVARRRRSAREGTLAPADARLIDGRWVVPGEVFLFTGRGERLLEVQLDGKSAGGFLMPVPARPCAAHEQWSDWLPRPLPGHEPWPDDKISYRFRVRPIEPPPPPPDPEALAAEEFAALPDDAPLAARLAFLAHDAPQERAAAILAAAQARPDELAKAIASDDAELRAAALRAVMLQPSVPQAVVDAVLVEGRAIADAVSRFNTMASDDPEFWNVQIELRGRFTHWKHAWWGVQQRLGLDGRPPVQAIHDLALVRAKETSMDEIVVNARVILDALAPSGSETR